MIPAGSHLSPQFREVTLYLLWLAIVCLWLWGRRQTDRVQMRMAIGVCVAAIAVFTIVAIRTPPADSAEWVGWGMAVLTPVVGIVLIRLSPRA